MKIRSFSFISSLLLFLIVSTAVIFVPKSNWKNIFSGRFNNFATVFSSTFNSTDQQPDTTVDIIISDGTGGAYIGGAFSVLGTTTRNKVAHILSDGSVDPNFDPNLNGEVTSLALSPDGNTLYLGGNFTSVGTTSINRLAAVNTSDGSIISAFNPSVTGGYIYTMAFATSSNILYIGGEFTSVDSVSHTYLSAVDAADGSLIPTFSHDGNGGVYAMAMSPDQSTLYIGGAYTTLGGTTRRHIAAMDITTATGTISSSFNPGTAPSLLGQGQVYALTISPDGNTIYMGGNFNGVNSVSRNFLAAVDTSGSVITSFNPSPDDQVFAITLSDDILYFAGIFTSVASVPYGRLAGAYTADGSMVTSFTPDLNTDVFTVAVSSNGNTLYAGGNFVQVNSIIHSYFASFPVFVPPSPAARHHRLIVAPEAAPTATTSTTTTFSLKLNATIVDDSGTTITDRGFEYGLTTSYGLVASSTGTFSSGSFSETITGLLPNTEYHYRAFAVDAYGIVTTSDFTFTLSEDGSLSAFSASQFTSSVSTTTTASTTASSTTTTNVATTTATTEPIIPKVEPNPKPTTPTPAKSTKTTSTTISGSKTTTPIKGGSSAPTTSLEQNPIPAPAGQNMITGTPFSNIVEGVKQTYNQTLSALSNSVLSLTNFIKGKDITWTMIISILLAIVSIIIVLYIISRIFKYFKNKKRETYNGE